jgi:hypothetical protein
VNQNSQPLAPAEQSLLSYVETMRNGLNAAAVEARKNQTADECVSMGAHCNHVVDAYIGLLPTAQVFSAAGLPRLGQRLAEVIVEAQNSSRLWFAAVVRSWKNPPPPPGPSAAELAQRAQQERHDAKRAAQQAQFAAWQTLHDEQQAAFDAQNKRWSESHNKH